MPSFGSYDSERILIERSKKIRAKLIAKGLDPRSQGFSRAYYKAMRK